LKGLFRLGHPALCKIHSSAHTSYKDPWSYIVAIGNPERHVRKASHRGSKQQ